MTTANNAYYYYYYYYKNINLFLIIFVASAFVLGLVSSYAYGQQQTTATVSEKVNEVQDQIASNTSQIDTTTAAAGVGIAGAAVAVAKQFFDQKTNKKRDRTTDGDAGRFIILQSKFYQLKKLYPELSEAELLDLPVSNNPFATQTFGQAFTSEGDLWADGNTSYWGIPKPNMSVPTRTTLDAVKASTAAPPTQPPPPQTNVVADAGIQIPQTKPVIPVAKPNPAPPTPSSQTQQQTSAATTSSGNNTTVGK